MDDNLRKAKNNFVHSVFAGVFNMLQFVDKQVKHLLSVSYFVMGYFSRHFSKHFAF